MNSVRQYWRVVLGLVLLAALYACVAGVGYEAEGYGGDYYEPYGYDYGGWGPGYWVGPPRGGPRGPAANRPRPFRAPPPGRSMPSVPNGHRGR